MLNRLRKRFVALTMIIVGIVLTCVSAAICITDYQRSVADVHAALDRATSPLMQAESDMQANGEESSDDFKSEAKPKEGNEDTTNPPSPVIGGKEPARDRVIPVAVYSIAEDGSYDIIEGRTTALIDENVLDDAISRISYADDGYGLLPSLGLFYEKQTSIVDGSSVARVAFADQSAASSWQVLALICVGAETAALLALLAISWGLSKQALRPVERAWEQQRQFVANASHELKTPLAVILANTSILEKHPESSIASHMQWVESTRTEANRMNSLVGDMLELAALDDLDAREDPVPFCKERIDFSDLAEGVVLQFESIAFERTINFETNLERGLIVEGDRARLSRMAATLVENACKYAGCGGSVQVTLRAEGSNASLAIRNTGSPIPPEDLPHVFDRFYRADKARTRNVGGYGLGLSIAQSIAQAHGGSIVAQSSEKDGTTFTAALPLTRF